MRGECGIAPHFLCTGSQEFLFERGPKLLECLRISMDLQVHPSTRNEPICASSTLAMWACQPSPFTVSSATCWHHPTRQIFAMSQSGMPDSVNSKAACDVTASIHRQPAAKMLRRPPL